MPEFIKKQTPLRSLGVKLGLAVSAVGLLAVLLLPLGCRNGGREAADRTISLNNVKNLTLALMSYHAEFGSFPPAYTVSPEGEPLHSWRTLILPYLDEQAMFDQIDFTKPWDDPVNQKFHSLMPQVFGNPRQDQPGQMTCMSVMAGEDYCLHPTKGRRMRDVYAEARNVLLVVQVPEKAAVNWMEPRDRAAEYLGDINAFGPPVHDGVIVVSMMDGSCQAISVDTNPEVLQQLMSISDDVTDKSWK